MRRLLFILGRQADLALAELVSALKTSQIQYSPTRVGDHELLVETGDELGDLQEFLNRLGGTIKIIELDQELAVKDASQFKAPLQELLKTDEIYRTYHTSAKGSDKKKPRWTFGISISAPAVSRNSLSELKKVVHRIALKVKQDLKSKNISSRFVAARGKTLSLSSVVVRKNKLNQENGTEIILLLLEKSFLRGKTVAVQDFEAYGARDYERPARNARAGSLPPKLAQILINLTRLKPPSAIFDPFAGQGTLLQEGALQGYLMSGADQDIEQVGNAKKNMSWLKKQGLIEKEPEVSQAAVKSIRLDPAVKAVVTEGVLGPPHSGPVSADQANNSLGQISKLWLSLLRDLSAQTDSGFIIVCTWPVLKKTDGSYQFLDILDSLKELGYSLDAILPLHLRSKRADQVAEQAWEERGTLLYYRPGQSVLREIIRLIKV